MVSQNEPNALQHLMALRAAAAIAFTAATKKPLSDLATSNKVARIIAERVPIFTRDIGSTEPARVLPLEIHEGRFENGGEELRFLDGRAPIADLAILHRELAKAIAAVRDLYRQGED